MWACFKKNLNTSFTQDAFPASWLLEHLHGSISQQCKAHEAVHKLLYIYFCHFKQAPSIIRFLMRGYIGMLCMGFQWVTHLKSTLASPQSVILFMDGPYMLACAVHIRLFHNALTFSFHLALWWSWCSFSRRFQISKPFFATALSKGGTNDFFLNFVQNWPFFGSRFRLINHKGFRTCLTYLARLMDSMVSNLFTFNQWITS